MLFPKSLASAVADLRSAGLIVQAPPLPKWRTLSPSQVETVLLYRSGYRGAQLAQQLGVSLCATEQRIKRAMQLLGVSDRADLMTVDIARIVRVQ